MSAAVIGRQLRQQATTGRTSGPLVPPQVPGKGRPRTPSHVPTSGRPYSPAPASMTGTSGERYNVIPGAGGGGGGPGGTHLNYPSSHSGLHGKEDRGNKGEEPKLRCTWHCFCVALKALSGGLVLFVAGTIMSVVGFVADANHNSTQTLSNDTVIETPLPSVFRNLTFAGPVIMGLGGIVIVAALVLTFEVRDTLGVKVVPAKPAPTTNTGTGHLPPSLPTNNSLHPNKDSIQGHGKGGGGGSVGGNGAGGPSTHLGNKISNSSSSTVPSDQRKETIPSIASTLSPENRIAGQSIDGSLLKKTNLELGLLSSTAAKTTGATLSAGAIRSTNHTKNGNNHHQTGKETLKLTGNSNSQESSLRNGSGGPRGGKIKLDPSSLTIPFDVLSDLGPVTGSSHRQRLGDISTETAFNGLLPLDDPLILMDSGRSAARGKHGNESRNENKVRGGKSHQGYQVQQSTSTGGGGASGVDLNKQLASFSSGATSLSHVISPNIESYYFALPSPQETELSDPEGCSLTVPARWRSSRCSCSASPTHSMSMELYLDHKDPPINIKIIEQQRIQEQLIIQQQILLKQQQDQLQRLIEQANLGRHSIPFHRPKVLASIESDGLSSTSSSSDDLFVPLRRSRPSSSTSPFNTNHHHHHHHHPYQASSTASAPHHHLYHQHHPPQQQQQVKSSQQRPTITSIYQQQSSSLIGHHHQQSSSHQTRPNSGPTTTATMIDEQPSSSFGFRSELSSEFSSNASELDSPLHIDLDEDLSKALEKLKSPPPSKQLKSKSKDGSSSNTTKDEVNDEDESVKEDERDVSESTRLLPTTTSSSSKLSPTIKINRPGNSGDNNTGDNSISSESTASTTTDKRFPLLREGALSNGSVPNRKR